MNTNSKSLRVFDDVAAATNEETYYDERWPRATESAPHGPLAGIVRVWDWYGHGPATKTPPHYSAVPTVLTTRPNWIWLEERIGPLGKPVTEPHLCRGVDAKDALMPCNWAGFHVGPWLPYTPAYVLTDEIIHDEGRLVAILVSRSSGMTRADVTNLWIALGCTYMEYAIDGDGWILLGTSREEIPNFYSLGIQIVCSEGYLELAGLGATGCLRDITEEIKSFHAFKSASVCKDGRMRPTSPSTPHAVARVREQLTFISADCSYDVYRRVVWALLSTGWAEAYDLALSWSQTAPERFEWKTFDTLVRGFDPDRSDAPTLGSIWFLARQGGWCGTS